MACHYSDETEYPCNGYLAVEGWTNLAVRVAAIEKRLDLNAIVDACEGIDLYDNFGEMLAALEEKENDGH